MMRKFQDNNPRPRRWDSHNPVTRIFASDLKISTAVPEEKRAIVHRDGRHFKLVFAENIKYNEACDFVTNELGLKRSQIDSFIFKSLKVYEVEAKSVPFADHIKERIENLCKQNKLSCEVKIEDFTPATTALTVLGVPKVFPDSELQKLIQGKLKTRIRKAAADIDQKHQWYTGKRMYYIDTQVLKSATIPEYITWNNGEWRFYLSYPGQIKTCRKCGKEGHYAKECTANPSDSEREDEYVERKPEESQYEVGKTSDEPKNDIRKSPEPKPSDSEESEAEGMISAFERKTDQQKRKSSTSPNKGGISKKLINETSKPSKIRPRKVSMPNLKIAPRSNIRKSCYRCQDNEYVVESDIDFFISHCEVCDPVCLNASTKCFEKECVLLKTWNKLPADRERIICANKACETIKYVCKCNMLHSVKTIDNDYECEHCHAHVNPSL